MSRKVILVLEWEWGDVDDWGEEGEEPSLNPPDYSDVFPEELKIVGVKVVDDTGA